jgi:multiple sugar transport system permease protein
MRRRAVAEVGAEVGVDTARPVRDRRRRSDGSSARAYSGVLARVVLIALSLLFLLPLYWMIASALKSNEELGAFPPTLFPHELHWDNFAAAMQIMPFLTFFRNTLVITALTVVFAVVSNFVVAYGFACLRWPGRDKVFYVVLATLFVPFPISLIPLFDLYANLGWVNTFLPLVVPHLFGSAFYVFLLRQFLLQFPRDILEAASIDGAGPWRTMWTVVLPAARPALATVAIFSGVAAWNDFLGPLIYLQDQSVQTLSIGLQAYRLREATEDVQFNVLMAASLMIVIPLIVLFFLFQRHFLRGITLGSFK